MIDLNIKQKQEEEDTPIGLQILMLMPLMIIFFGICMRVL